MFAWSSCLLHCRVCSQLAQRPSAQGKSDPSKRIALVVQSLILLRETLQALPCLAQALKCTDSCLLQVRGQSTLDLEWCTNGTPARSCIKLRWIAC